MLDIICSIFVVSNSKPLSQVPVWQFQGYSFRSFLTVNRTKYPGIHAYSCRSSRPPAGPFRAGNSHPFPVTRVLGYIASLESFSWREQENRLYLFICLFIYLFIYLFICSKLASQSSLLAYKPDFQMTWQATQN